jgi:hypothetical protein
MGVEDGALDEPLTVVPYLESNSASPVPNTMGVEAGALGEPLTVVLTWSPTVPALCRIRWVLRLVRWVTHRGVPMLLPGGMHIFG